jgi:hypothetical protein
VDFFGSGGGKYTTPDEIVEKVKKDYFGREAQ